MTLPPAGTRCACLLYTSVGNIIGANIIDLTLILPISAMIYGGGLPVSRQVAMMDLQSCLLVGCLAVIPALISKKFRRSQGIVLLFTYAAYVVLTCSCLLYTSRCG